MMPKTNFLKYTKNASWYNGRMLIEFIGRECEHCERMVPLVNRLEEEEKVTIETREVWHDLKNMEEFRKLDNKRCGGVPFFINTETNAFICGEAPYEELKKWAKGSS